MSAYLVPGSVAYYLRKKDSDNFWRFSTNRQISLYYFWMVISNASHNFSLFHIDFHCQLAAEDYGMSWKAPVSCFVFEGFVCYWTFSLSKIMLELNRIRITAFYSLCASLYLHLWSRKLDHTWPYLALSCRALISKPFNHARLCDCFVTQMYSH